MSQKIIISLISFALGIILIIVFVAPLWSSSMDLAGKVSEHSEEVVELKELLRETERLSQEYQGISEEASQFLTALPDKEDLPHLLVQLEGMASNSGLLLESVEITHEEENNQAQSVKPSSAKFAPFEVKKNSSLKVLPVKVNLNGPYQALKSYLNALENSLRPMDIYSVDFSIYENQETQLLNTPGIFKFTLELGVYYTASE